MIISEKYNTDNKNMNIKITKSTNDNIISH